MGDKLSKKDLEREGAELLPDREAMTVINTGSPLPLANPDGIPIDSDAAREHGMKIDDPPPQDDEPRTLPERQPPF